MYTRKPLYSPASCSLLKWPPRSLHRTWTTLPPMPSTPQQHLSTTLTPLPRVSLAMATPTATSPVHPPAPLRCTRPSLMPPLLPPLPSSSTHHSSICNPSACSEGQTSQVSFREKNMRIKTIALSHQDLSWVRRQWNCAVALKELPEALMLLKKFFNIITVITIIHAIHIISLIVLMFLFVLTLYC